MKKETQMPFPIQTVEVRNFRGFVEGKLNDIGRVNVLVGKNNTGKTTLLESILLLYNDPRLSLSTVTKQRGWNFPSSLEYLIRSESKKLELQAISKERTIKTEIRTRGTMLKPYLQVLGKAHREGFFLFGQTEIHNNKRVRRYVYQIAVDKEGEFAPPFTTSPGSEVEFDLPILFLESCLSARRLEDIYSDIVKKGKMKDLINFLKPIYDIDDIRLRKENGSFVLYVQTGRRVVPVSVCGDGFKWSFSVLSEILSMKHGIMLIDDLENFHHPSSLRDAVKTLISLMKKKDIQIFATTHSLECIDRFIEESRASNVDFRLHFLRRLKGKVFSATYRLEEAKEARELIGLDLRGK